MDIIRIYQMQDTNVTVSVSPAFAEVKVEFYDKDMNPVELYMDMESGLRVIRDFDRFDSVRNEFKVSLSERLQDPWVAFSLIGCLVAWVLMVSMVISSYR